YHCRFPEQDRCGGARASAGRGSGPCSVRRNPRTSGRRRISVHTASASSTSLSAVLLFSRDSKVDFRNRENRFPGRERTFPPPTPSARWGRESKLWLHERRPGHGEGVLRLTRNHLDRIVQIVSSHGNWV